MFETLVGRKVSILFEGLNGKESWVGIIKSIDNDFIVLDVNFNKSNVYEIGYIKSVNIISVLIYKERLTSNH